MAEEVLSVVEELPDHLVVVVGVADCIRPQYSFLFSKLTPTFLFPSQVQLLDSFPPVRSEGVYCWEEEKEEQKRC